MLVFLSLTSCYRKVSSSSHLPENMISLLIMVKSWGLRIQLDVRTLAWCFHLTLPEWLRSGITSASSCWGGWGASRTLLHHWWDGKLV